MKKYMSLHHLFLVVLASVVLFPLRSTSATVAEGISVQTLTDEVNVVRATDITVAKFRVATSSPRVLMDAWQMKFQVTDGEANDLGTVRLVSEAGETIAYSEVFAHVGDQGARTVILVPSQTGWGTPQFQSYPLRDGEVLSVVVDTGSCPDGTGITTVSQSLVAIDMATPNPFGEIVYDESEVTTSVTVRSVGDVVPETDSRPVVEEVEFNAEIVWEQYGEFSDGGLGVFCVFAEPLPEAFRVSYLNESSHWVEVPESQVWSNEFALLFVVDGEVLAYKILTPP